MIFDSPNLTWRSHIEYLRMDFMQRMKIMKVMASTKWGASTKIMRLFYIAYIRAKLDYGSILYSSAASTHLKKSEVLQNSCIRMILGARMSTPLLSLQAESHIQPLTLRRDYLTVKEYARLLYRPSGDHTNKALGILNGINRETIEPFNSFIYKTKKIMKIVSIDKMRRTPTS